jgi:hypothetical protein
MVRIADRVWPAAAALYEEQDLGARVGLLLVPAGDVGEAERALAESVLEVHEHLDAELPDPAAWDTPTPGEWEWVAGTDGVLIAFGDSMLFETELRAVAAALSRRGVDGEIDLREPVSAPELPEQEDLLECRVRIRGRREHGGESVYFWRCDRDAQWAFLAAADRWRRSAAEGAVGSVQKGAMPPVPVPADEEAVDRLSTAADGDSTIVVSASTPGGFRSVTVHPYSGGVSLVIGGAEVRADRWPHALAELTAILREHADLLAYGYVRRGWQVGAAVWSSVFGADWPQRPNDRPAGGGFASEAFEDVYAPDVFGVQVLGPGYAGRVPEHPKWRTEPVGTASVLLEHTDPAAWYAAPPITPRRMICGIPPSRRRRC